MAAKNWKGEESEQSKRHGVNVKLMCWRVKAHWLIRLK
jgi:hypothetical protein